MAIHASLLAIAEEVILWAARVPDADIAVIAGMNPRSSGKPKEVTPQSPGVHIGCPTPLHITTDFLHPLALPAECLSASDKT